MKPLRLWPGCMITDGRTFLNIVVFIKILKQNSNVFYLPHNNNNNKRTRSYIINQLTWEQSEKKNRTNKKQNEKESVATTTTISYNQQINGTHRMTFILCANCCCCEVEEYIRLRQRLDRTERKEYTHTKDESFVEWWR